jgi:hypothetical protein
VSTRQSNRKAWQRRILCVILSSLAIVTSLGLTGRAAGAAPRDRSTTTTTPTSTGGGGTDSKGVANPKLTAVVSLSRHRVLVTYDRDLDAAALSASSYAFYSTQAVNLPVTGVARATNNQAFVMTGPQEPVTYTVKQPKTSRPVTFQGSTATEPKVLNATAVSTTQILVTFSEPMGTGAYQPSSYQITVQGSSASLAVTGAAQFGSGQTQVLLTTAPQQPLSYVLTVDDIQSLIGIYMDPTGTSMQLGGSAVLPGPMLLGAASDGDTKVVLTFDSPLDPTSATNPANYTGTPNLFIQSATLQADNRQVVLVTSPQYQLDYSLVVNVTGADGNPVNPAYNSASFRGNLPVNNERPKVTSAASTSNKSVLVQFSKPMADSTADPSRFAIVQTVVHPEVGALVVTGAEFVGTDRLSVKLTTMSQAEVTYQVTANNVTDLMGNPLADRTNVGGVLVDPTSFTFPGTPPTECPGNPPPGTVATSGKNADLAKRKVLTGTATKFLTTFKVGDTLRVDGETNRIISAIASDTSLTVSEAFSADGSGLSYRIRCADEPVNSDDDALYDHEETRGWQLTIALSNGGTQLRQVTSSPFNHDSDEDGVTDDVERSLNIDPRDKDTDDDGLSDFTEYNEIFSDPTKQDSDGDGLFDGLEVTFFRTSAIQLDTDGDQRDDGDEINVNRNPKVADTPRSALEIGAMDLALDVRFEDTNSSGQTNSHSDTATATLSQSQSKEYSTTDARTIEASTRLAQTAGVSVTAGYAEKSPVGLVTLGYEATHEQGSSLSFTSSFTETSGETATQEYQRSLTSSEELTSGSSRTRHVEAGSIKVATMLRSVGDIAFTMRNVQISALVQDPEDPSRLTPVATLVPEAPEPPTGFSLGPLAPERGPVIFASKPDQVFPQQIEDLMRNPRSVVFRFANYDITDEKGRNFAFTSQDIYDRTGGVVIDYGRFDGDGDGRGDATENHRVATGIGRFVADSDASGFISEAEGRAPRADKDDPSARWVVFDENGKQVGLTLRESLQATGLTEYNEGDDPTSGLTQAQRNSSYSVIDVPGVGQRLFRVRGAQPETGKEWQVWTPTGLDRTLSLDDMMMTPGKTFRLTYVEDVDGDGLSGVLEWTNGCKDTAIDSDGDTLDDRFETTRGWNVAPGQWGKASTPSGVFSSCHSPDSDEDALSDVDEAPALLRRDGLGLVVSATAPAVGAGTVRTNGTTTLTGTGTKFSTMLRVGETISVAGEGARAIEAIASDTSLTVSAPFSTSASGLDYVFTGTSPERRAIGTTTTVASEAAMLALPAKRGDFAIRSDLDTDGGGPIHAPLFMLTAENATVAANWVQAPTNDPTTDTDPVKRAMGDPVSNPGRKDTDGDSVNDGDELKPHSVKLRFPTEADSRLLITSPEWADSDGDSARDGLEALIGGNPTQSDRNNFADDDNDGLVNIQETTGWSVEIEEVSKNPSWDVPTGAQPSARQPCRSVCDAGLKTVSPSSLKPDPKVKDTDGDSLTDRDEMDLGTDPTREDTDSDGLKDPAEVNGFALAPFGTIKTDPLDADTDDDRRSDGAEANLVDKFIVRLEGGTPYQVFSNPTDPDRDFDMLVDGEEFLVLTDPGKADTDGDPRSDFVEVDLGRNPLLPDMIVDMTFSRIEVLDGGDPGSDAGDFQFFLYGVRPDGKAIPAVHGFPTAKDGDDPTGGAPSYQNVIPSSVNPISLPTCGESPCRQATAEPVISIGEGETVTFLTGTLPGRKVHIGSVSTTDKVPQQFGVQGYIFERDGSNPDHGQIDCRADFPDPFVLDTDGVGSVRGADIKLGTQSMQMHRKLTCNIEGPLLEFNLYVSYTAS